ncbi:hypothetical protein O6H91_24G000200 [Diphasiastrum complanatum]|uniref:Uncharacterized protein n=1 Tax=Diphasiastrum complanatum TaxID=34168 RepID=A0ACC2A7B5_DIPCM|nr:hypothetical protein O6H91_24G000200 [Diphasiastrum complanatum]
MITGTFLCELAFKNRLVGQATLEYQCAILSSPNGPGHCSGCIPGSPSERGAKKKHEFTRKLARMFAEEQRMRIPVAQRLPWTTDEPQTLPKPPVKENTVPLGIHLFSDVRACERAKFDEYVAAKFLLMEQEMREHERLQQIAEQEEIKRMRSEMVPHAQLMPYFDRPFMPKRSSKHLTIPKEPSFSNV